MNNLEKELLKTIALNLSTASIRPKKDMYIGDYCKWCDKFVDVIQTNVAILQTIISTKNPEDLVKPDNKHEDIFS